MQKIKFVLIITLLSMFVLNSCNYKRKLTAKNIRLLPVYSSGMVLQSSPKTSISGYAEPGSTLAVKIDDYVRITKANNKGLWQVTFPEIILKRPFSITFEGQDTSFTFNNVLAGDIYMVAGDAFIERLSSDFPVECNKSYSENSYSIRVFQTNIRSKGLQKNPYPYGKWFSSNEAVSFLKTCKVVNLIRELEANSGKPIGLIDLTKPGTSIDDWIMPEKEEISLLAKLTSSNSGYQSDDLIVDTILALRNTSYYGINAGAARIWYIDEYWNKTDLPVNIASKFNYQHNRIVYLRKKIYIPSEYLNSEFYLNLGYLQGEANFYFNEHEINPGYDVNGQIKLIIADSLMRVWSNILAIRLFCTDSLAGFYGDSYYCINKDSSYNRPIDKDWKYNSNLEQEFPNQKVSISIDKGYLLTKFFPLIESFSYSSFIWFGGISDLNNTKELGNKICSFFDIDKKINHLQANYILIDPLFSKKDSLLYSYRLKKLKDEFAKTSESCGAKIIKIRK